ncbi:MAG: GDP-mannose 4,6-dehydratase [Planctomycetota bacterium]
MKALVTGGAGFIGSHLSESLLNLGWSVAVVDDLSTGSLANIAAMQNNTNFHFIQGSICDSNLMRSFIDNCDVVFHLAAAVGVRLIVEQPVRTIRTNIHGTEVMLELACKFHKKVLITSTSEVYGKSTAVPFCEDDDSIFGSTRFSRWSYACSKAIDEFLAFAYHDEYDVPVIITRLFNTIGPRQTGRYGMVVPRFINLALKNEPILIYGTGRQTRCFACITDIVDGLITLMQCPEAPGRIFNLGSTEEISINDLADRIIQKTASKSEKKFIPYEQAYGRPFDDMMQRVPCIHRVHETIGWRPKLNLDETLGLIIADIKRT